MTNPASMLENAYLIRCSSIISGALLYNKLSNKVKAHYPEKIANNAITFLHCISCIFLSYLFISSQTYSQTLDFIIGANTAGYFLYDIKNLINKTENRFSPLNMIYIYHHIFTISIIFLNKINHAIIPILFYAELSTIPTIILYHDIKTNPEGKHTLTRQTLKLIQVISFVPIRIIVLGYYTYNEVFNPTTESGKVPLAIYLASPLYFFGVLWSIIIIIQNIPRHILKN